MNNRIKQMNSKYNNRKIIFNMFKKSNNINVQNVEKI